MRRYQKWLSMGLLTLTPHLALAAEPDSPEAAQAAKKEASPNQKLAEKVAKSLRKAHLSQFDIEIDVRNGVVTLMGTIGKPEQRASAEKAVLAVSGVTRVVNRLQVARPAVEQAAATGSPANRKVRPTAGERPAYGGIEGAQEGAMPAPYAEPQRIAQNGPPQPLTPVPQGAVPQQGMPVPQGQPQYCPPGGQMMQHPGAMPMGPGGMPMGPGGMQNYAMAGYGGQQAASAYPYIGPYYPYPQIPLGWRKASLEWDDGYWNLNFRSRTDKWWWYLNPQNW